MATFDVNCTTQYFGETFDTNLCNKTCDNCQHVGERISKDVTQDAKNFVNLVKSFGNDRVTLKMCQDIFTCNILA